ncbi:MAG TPA: glutamine-hydrolyzing carbamoyl-phosphate synthase small subunit [Bacillota bacterium]|nr:glutamine-hydrolyzing carbamoyl-phosphate synthase small subunit [Bacillota bacterium]
MKQRKLVLENGAELYGRPFGADSEGIFELVFNTSMAGYQEIVSDPSYCDQAVVMSYPLIGNYGMTDEDYESRIMPLGAMIVREYTDTPSNFRYTKTLSEVFEENGVAGLCGVDTRRLVRMIRSGGNMKCMITDADTPLEDALERVRAYALRTDQVSRCSCGKRRWSRTPNHRYTVAVIDCGAKLNIIRSLNERCCNVIILPYNTSAQEIRALSPDGLLLSNGPGDPENVPEVIKTIRALRGELPIFGICLGHQLIALACGGKTGRLKFGHHGGNHPVRNLTTGRTEITSQNHNFTVIPESVAGTGLEITHINLLDGTVEGMNDASTLLYSVQYHPEAFAGPQDSRYHFDDFIKTIQEHRKDS